MYNILFMNVLNSLNDLLIEFTSFDLMESSSLDNVIKELSPCTVLHNQVYLFISFDDFV